MVYSRIIRFVFLSACLFFFFAISSSVTFANQWYQTGLSGWEFTNPNSMVIAGDGTVYVSTDKDSESDFSLFKSLDNGETWISLRDKLPVITRIDAIDVDPRNSNIVYISLVTNLRIAGGGIYKSEDGGLTWAKILPGIRIIDITVDKNNPENVYALEATLTSYQGFYKSTDYGVTWRRYSNGISIYPTHFRSIVVDPVDSKTLYITATLQTDKRYGLHKSADRGENWTQINDGFDLDLGTFWSMAIDLHNNRNLFLSTSGLTQNNFVFVPGVYKSTDAGISWNRVSEEFPNLATYDVQINEKDPNIIISSTNSIVSLGELSRCGVMMSKDSGENWIIINEGLPINNKSFCTGTLRINSKENYVILMTNDGIWKRALDSTPPTPTPQPCVLTNFPNPIRQDQGSWSTTPYGGTYETIEGVRTFIPFKFYEQNPLSTTKDSIASWGCNLTSHAMNINYYASLQNIEFQTDPGILNTWLQEHNGYSTGAVLYDSEKLPYVESSLVRSEAVSRYAKEKGVTLSYASPVSYNPKTQTGLEFTGSQGENLNTQLCVLQPALLKVKFPSAGKPGHFVVASGIARENNTDTWRIHDPLKSTTSTLFQSYENTFYQLQKAATQVPREFLQISAHSPVEFIVTDPQGNKTGMTEAQEQFDDIPDSYYGLDTLVSSLGDEIIDAHDFIVHNPVSGLYSIDVIGIGDGNYSLDIAYSDGDTIHQLPVVFSETGRDIHDIYTFSTDSPEESQLVRTISIDFPVISGNDIAAGNSNRKFPITIYSEGKFNPEKIDRSAMVAGSGNARPIEKNEKLLDLNGDAINDLVSFFTLKELGIDDKTSEVCIQAVDQWGSAIKGCDLLEFSSQGSW